MSCSSPEPSSMKEPVLLRCRRLTRAPWPHGLQNLPGGHKFGGCLHVHVFPHNAAYQFILPEAYIFIYAQGYIAFIFTYEIQFSSNY